MAFINDRREFLKNNATWVMVVPRLPALNGGHALLKAAGKESGQPEGLEKAFLEPPDSAWPWVDWFVSDGNLTRESITADFEAMHPVGIRGVLYLEIDQNVPKGPVRFLSPQWREMIQHAVKEATRLGITVNMNNDGGWCCRAGLPTGRNPEVFAENPSAPLLFMGEDIVGSHGLIFSPHFIRHKALPIWKRIARPIKEKGFKFLYHTVGRAKEILPIIVNEFGAEGFKPIEWNGCNDIFEIRRNYPGLLLFGNVCCETTLPYGTPEQGEQETLELIERIGPQGGVLIDSSSEVYDLVPVENALRMYETVQRYGRCPIKGSKHSSEQRATA